MPIDYLLSFDVLIMILAIFVAGLVRGFTGGAGANFFSAPVLSILIGPREAVPIVLLLNGLTIIQLVPGAARHVQWREAWPIGLAAAVMLPFGAWALFAVDETLMRRIIAGVAVVFSLLLLSGWRYRGPRGLGLSMGAGGMGGVLAGAVSMGGPPVFLYLMSGPGDAVTNRSQFIMFSVFVLAAAFVVFTATGVYTERMLWLGAVLVVPFVVATWIGIRLFRLASDELFRRISLWMMAGVSLAILVL
jgi:uncharacterized membrane protein YfcA